MHVFLCQGFFGTYSGHEVAVKVFNHENMNQNACNEFKHEIYMLRYSTFLWIFPKVIIVECTLEAT